MYAYLFLASMVEKKAGLDKRINLAIGEAQDTMCYRIPCCNKTIGVLTGKKLIVPGFNEQFLEVTVGGDRGYILREDISPYY